MAYFGIKLWERKLQFGAASFFTAGTLQGLWKTYCLHAHCVETPQMPTKSPGISWLGMTGAYCCTCHQAISPNRKIQMVSFRGNLLDSIDITHTSIEEIRKRFNYAFIVRPSFSPTVSWRKRTENSYNITGNRLILFPKRGILKAIPQNYAVLP